MWKMAQWNWALAVLCIIFLIQQLKNVHTLTCSFPAIFLRPINMHQKVLHFLFRSHNITTGPHALQHHSCIQASNTTDCTILDMTPSSRPQFLYIYDHQQLTTQTGHKRLGISHTKKQSCLWIKLISGYYMYIVNDTFHKTSSFWTALS